MKPMLLYFFWLFGAIYKKAVPQSKPSALFVYEKGRILMTGFAQARHFFSNENPMICVKCNSNNISKNGYYKAKGKKIQRLVCNACKKTFTTRTGTKFYRKRKQQYASNIVSMYCEGMSLRAITRVLKLNYKTVYKYFLEAARRAETAHKKTLYKGEIKTTYVQFDELETIEHTKRKPLGIELAIRPKTLQIISAHVSRIPIRALSVSRRVKEEYNTRITRKEKMMEMMIDVEKTINPNGILGSDSSGANINITKTMLPDIKHEIYSIGDYNSMWRLNHICAKLRNNVSRLRRKTWATTKRLDRLQAHLYLFIAYQNGYNI